MANKRDYYEVLGVSRDADESKIKRAFWKLAKQYHPDVNPGDKEAEAKFKEANEAYEVLSDAEKRQRYDQFGFAGVDGAAAGAQGFSGFGIDLDDIFSTLFGGGFGGFGGFGGGYQQARYNGAMPGANLRYRMKLDFMEAAHGVERTINIKKEDRCSKCSGHGTADGSEPEICSVCNGTGRVSRPIQTMFGQVHSTQPCSNCQGSGKVIHNPCSNCRGTGRETINKSLTVKIPAGINEGERLTLRGEGEPGQNGGPYGDLYIQIQIKPHPVFSRRGNDTYCDVPVTFAQAALGKEIEVPTIDGTVKYKLQPGTQPSDVYTIRNAGIPYVSRPGYRGDHHIKIILEVPYDMSDEQKVLLEQFDNSLSDNHYRKGPGFFSRIKTLFRDKEK